MDICRCDECLEEAIELWLEQNRPDLLDLWEDGQLGVLVDDEEAGFPAL